MVFAEVGLAEGSKEMKRGGDERWREGGKRLCKMRGGFILDLGLLSQMDLGR